MSVSNSYFLNLSDRPLPGSYPDLPSGFKYLQGEAARDFWADARADWIKQHGGGSSPSPSSPSNPGTAAPGTNTVVGTDVSQTLTGTAGVDSLSARGGHDRLFGKGGNDTLSGGDGQDKFVFDTAPNGGNVDTITDFARGSDRIYLDNAVFSKLGSAGSISSPNVLNSSFFEGDGSADDSNDFVLYNRSSGDLYYDTNGSSSGGSVKFAEVNSGLDLQYSDIFVV